MKRIYRRYWFQLLKVGSTVLIWHLAQAGHSLLSAVFLTQKHQWQIYGSRYIHRSFKSISFRLLYLSSYTFSCGQHCTSMIEFNWNESHYESCWLLDCIDRTRCPLRNGRMSLMQARKVPVAPNSTGSLKALWGQRTVWNWISTLMM